MALLAAVGTIAATSDMSFSLFTLVDSVSEYGEVLAFVPAAFVILRDSKKDDKIQAVPPEVSRRRALASTIFTVVFYFFEDLVTMFLTAWSSPFEAIAHILHFLLLVDFGVFMILYAYNP